MHDDPLVIIVHTTSCEIIKVLIDNENSSDLIYLTTLAYMGVLSLEINKKELPLVVSMEVLQCQYEL